MKRILLPSIIFFLLTSAALAQHNRHTNSIFFGGIAGAAMVNTSENNGKTPVAFVVGGSIGIPVPFVKNLFLYARTSYTSQSNFQSIYNTSYQNYPVQFSDKFVEVNSSFSQLILNGGLLYNIIVTDDFVLGLNGGLTFMVVNQEAKLRTGTIISSVDNENIWGTFGGLIVEKRWDDSNFSTYVEAQYNYAESDAVYRPGALSAMNYTFGVRYYLAGR